MSMYQSIYEYAMNRHLTKVKYRCRRAISAYIKLDDDGNFCGVEVIPKENRSPVVVPDTGNYYAAGMACPVCDKKATIFGDKKQHDSWISLMKAGEEYCKEFSAVNRFMERGEFSEVIKELENVKDGEFISFRVSNKNLNELTSWRGWFDRLMEEKESGKGTDKGISAVSGNVVDIITGDTKFPQCVGGIFGTGVPLFSNSHKRVPGVACSFKSYGMGSEACPMSQEEAETIQAGLEKLFSSEHNCSREHNMIYWLDHESSSFDNITAMTLKRMTKLDADKEKNFEDLLSSILTGNLINEEMEKHSGDMFHMMEFKIPDKGRFVLYEDNVETYREFLDNIRKWYNDTRLHVGRSNIDFITNIYAVFMSLVNKKDASNMQDEINGQFGTIKSDFIKAVMFGGKIPVQLYHDALRQADRAVVHDYYRSDMDTEVKKETIRKYSPKTALRIIKAYLIRKGYDMSENLNVAETNPGYLCGRLLAAVEKLQMDSNWDGDSKKSSLVVTIADRMYRGFEKDTGRLVNECITESRHYFQKLRRNPNKAGTEIYYHRIIDGIVSAFAETGGIPKKLSQEELGFFHIGYAMQRQEFYKSKKLTDDNAVEVETVEDAELF